jgi:hypothetical protein
MIRLTVIDDQAARRSDSTGARPEAPALLCALNVRPVGAFLMPCLHERLHTGCACGGIVLRSCCDVHWIGGYKLPTWYVAVRVRRPIAHRMRVRRA